MRISKALNDGGVDKWKFGMLEAFNLGALNELANNVDHKMEAKTRAQLEAINEQKKAVRKSDVL